MFVTDEERKHAEEFLTDVADDLTCPVCGEAEWVIEKVAVMELEEGASGEEHLADEGEVLAALQCRTCTHTLFFSAEIMEGRQVEQEEEGQEKSPEETG